MSRASRPGRVLVIAQDEAAGDGHARFEADEVTVQIVEGDSRPEIDGYDQVAVVGVADPERLASLVRQLLSVPGTRDILVGGGVAPGGSLAEWSAAFDGVGVSGFDHGDLALAIVDSTSGAGPVLYGLLGASVKQSPRLVAPEREVQTPSASSKVTPKASAKPTPVADKPSLLARVRASRRATLAVAAGITVVVSAVVAVLAGFLGIAVNGAVLGLLLVLVVANAVLSERRSRGTSQTQQIKRLESVIQRQTGLLESHSEQLAALRTSTSINELATVDIAKRLAQDVN